MPVIAGTTSCLIAMKSFSTHCLARDFPAIVGRPTVRELSMDGGAYDLEGFAWRTLFSRERQAIVVLDKEELCPSLWEQES